MQDVVTVLIADDETAIRHGLEEIVESVGADIRVIATADNGAEALLFIEQYEPDLAIIDINMPELDGLQVIAQANISKFKTRFFILSGYNDFSYAQTAIRFGVKSYFLKPLNIAEFCRELKHQSEEIRAERLMENDLSPQRLSSLVQSSKIYFLNQLVHNRLHTSTEITHKLKDLQLTLDNHTPCLVVILNASCHKDNGHHPLPLLVTDEIHTFFPDSSLEYWGHTDDQVLCVFHQANPKEQTFRLQLMDYIIYLQDNYSLIITAAIGDAVPALAQIAGSYLSAVEAMSYHIYDPDIRIYDTDVICNEKSTFSKEHIDYKPIIHAITHGNEQGIREYCSSFFQSLLFIKMPPPNFFIGMCMYLVMNVQKQVSLLYPDKKLDFDFRYEELDALGSTAAINDWMVNFFLDYTNILKCSTEPDNSIIKAAKEFIKQNLRQNIKATDVAQHVNLSSTYFTIYFKDKTGVNFRDYLLNTRINSAKKLLSANDQTVSEIADAVGYQDYRSFSRAFKNETGMSPSEYFAGTAPRLKGEDS